MRCRFFLSLLFILPIAALAQTDNNYIVTKEKKIDSLKKAFVKASPTQRVDILNELTAAYYNYQIDSSWAFSQRAINAAESIHFYKGLSLALAYRAYLDSNVETRKSLARQAVEVARKSDDAGQLGTTLFLLGNRLVNDNEYPEALQTLEMAESILKKAGDEKRLIKVHDSKGSAYLKMNRLYDGVKSLNESARLNKKIGDKTGYADALYNIGEIYSHLREDSIAISYYKQSIAVGAPDRTNNTWLTPHKLGNAYLNAKMYDSALHYYNQSISIINKMVDDPGTRQHNVFGAQVKIGEVYLLLGETDKALELLLPFYKHYKAKNDVNRLVQVLPKMGTAYLDKKDYQKTLIYANEMLPLCAKSKSGTGYKKAYDILADAYANLNRPDSAYYYLKLSTAIKDSIDRENFKSHTSFYKAMIENEAAQTKIELLNKDNQLKQQNLNFLIGGLIAFFILAIVFFNYLNVKRKNETHRRSLLEHELTIQKLESEKKQVSLQQHASELEMQALRAQMNPHFIFNCLNAVNHFILKNETEVASDYLTKFSRLIRLVLHNSSKKTISLADEMATLQLYIELEQVRFKNRFHFSIVVDENIDTESIMIPSMLLQPFVENAIWHGLMHKESNGELAIEVTQVDNKLRCTITDNGVGRQHDKSNKKESQQKKSMGTQITANRLKMIENENGPGAFTILDLKDAAGNNRGTKVIVTIPAAIGDTVAA